MSIQPLLVFVSLCRAKALDHCLLSGARGPAAVLAFGCGGDLVGGARAGGVGAHDAARHPAVHTGCGQRLEEGGNWG